MSHRPQSSVGSPSAVSTQQRPSQAASRPQSGRSSIAEGSPAPARPGRAEYMSSQPAQSGRRSMVFILKYRYMSA